MISMKSKLTCVLSAAVSVLLCGCGDSDKEEKRGTTYNVEIQQRGLPTIAFKSKTRTKITTSSNAGRYVYAPDGTKYIVLDGRITITPVKNDD